MEWRALVFAALLLPSTSAASEDRDVTEQLKEQLRRSDGGELRLETDRIYLIRKKLELASLCPNGISIVGNGATIQALPNFEHSVLLTSTELLRDKPYEPGASIRDLTLNGDGHVSRCVFGNWGNSRLHNLTVLGGTVYQVNAIWNQSTLSNIRIDGNAEQTNNGFDCNLQDSVIWNIHVDMHGNLKESGLWLNGSKQSSIINSYLRDGRTAFGLENCRDINLVNMNVLGNFSFRVINILPAEPSERIRLYDVQLETRHVGDDPSAGIHFNATRGGLVARAMMPTASPGVMISNDASEIDAIGVVSRDPVVHPIARWRRVAANAWTSSSRPEQRQRNRPPFVYAGPDRTVKRLQKVKLAGAVADELKREQLVIRWSKVAGQGRVRINSPKTDRTLVSCSRPGRYTFRLTANDGEHESTDEVTLTITRTRSTASR